MTLGKMQHELVKAGADSLTCSQCAEAMLLHKHCTANANLTSMQAARMLWLVLICQDTAEVRTESLLLQTGQYMPSHNEETALQFLAAIIRSNAAASEVEAIHVDATAREMTVEILDGDEITFTTHERTPYQEAPQGSASISGGLICRLSTAYNSRVWLPSHYSTLTYNNDSIQEKRSA